MYQMAQFCFKQIYIFFLKISVKMSAAQSLLSASATNLAERTKAL